MTAINVTTGRRRSVERPSASPVLGQLVRDLVLEKSLPSEVTARIVAEIGSTVEAVRDNGMEFSAEEFTRIVLA